MTASIEVRQTEVFSAWLAGLRDKTAAARIAMCIVRLQSRLSGDVKPIGDSVFELRIDYGPGYRAYFVQRGTVLIVLLCGGDKGSQGRDIVAAKALAATPEI